MTHYGVCIASEERCGLSYESHGLQRLPELLHVIRLKEQNGQDTAELKKNLDQYTRFFQTGTHCTDCNGELMRVTQATAHLDPKSDEYKRTVILNSFLDSIPILQNMGALTW